MMTVDEALYIADDRKDNGVFIDASDDAAIALAAEVRRLRFDILAMNQSLDLLREENKRLRKDAERYRWFRAAPLEDVLRLSHYAVYALDAAIDSARGAK